MSTLHSIRFPALAAIIVALSARLGATVLLGTLPLSDNGNSNTDNGVRWAFAFTMPATSYTLDNVSVRIYGYDSSETLVAGFYTNSGGLPGTSIGSMTTTTGQGNVAVDYSFTAGSTLTFAANTTYWFVWGIDSGQVQFRYQSGVTGNPTGAATFSGAKITSNSVNYFDVSDPAQYAFQINATAIPEPSTYAAIVAVCAMGVAAWRRHRQPGRVSTV